MKEKLGMPFSKDALVALVSPGTHVTAKLDHDGCYLKFPDFSHKCILKQLDRKDFKVRLQYHLWPSPVDEAFVVGCQKTQRVEKTMLGGVVRS